MKVQHIVVPRTARYVVLGEPTAEVRELWIALHGYGQLASEFAKALTPIVDRTRVVVVPEGLSRFYLSSPARGTHAEARVGATWMTREDREAEIGDQVTYLDALVTRLRVAELEPSVSLTVLGFSQGVATAARWVARSDVAVDRMILWCGTFPDDVDPSVLISGERDTRVILVTGDRDDVVSADAMSSSESRLAALGPRYRRVRFDGGHRLDRHTLLDLSRHD